MLDIQLPVQRPKYQVVNQFHFPPMFDTTNILSALDYKARPDDVFVVTFPKCGTTWTVQMCNLIINNGDPSERMKNESIHSVSPFLEMSGSMAADNMNRPGIMKTHLPFNLTPNHPQAKYINVIRNPKDACVSYYYHTRMFKGYEFTGDFHDYLKCWLMGEIDYGQYADHVLSWWKHRNDDNVLVLFYEEMKEDAMKAVWKICDFLGSPYSLKAKSDPEFVARVVRNSSFPYMKETTNKIQAELVRERDIIQTGVEFNFIRKGIVGDWKNHFTREESELFNKWFAEKFAGTDLENAWTKYGIFDF